MIASHPESGQKAKAAAGRFLRLAATAFAGLGGVVLCAMVLLVVASVIGRAIFAMPVPGDFEIVAVGTAVSIFLFLPYAYVERGNVTVDILADHLPAAAKRFLDVVAAALFAFVAGVFAWRMALGLIDTFSYGDITMIVGLPLWWAYPFAVASFALLAAAAAYTGLCGWDGLNDEL
jgi:TRAP-type C4-dicarboxylate transport system permease small subunit